MKQQAMQFLIPMKQYKLKNQKLFKRSLGALFGRGVDRFKRLVA